MRVPVFVFASLLLAMGLCPPCAPAQSFRSASGADRAQGVSTDISMDISMDVAMDISTDISVDISKAPSNKDHGADLPAHVSTPPQSRKITTRKIATRKIAAGDIVINEAYPRPLPSGSEFIELFNRSTATFDLRDLTIRDASSAPLPLSEASAPFPPGAYRVIAADGMAFSRRFSGVPYSEPARWASLNNGGDAIVLESGGRMIDSLFYAGSAVEEGRSLERIDPAGPSDPHNFARSSDPLGATPGAQNSQYAPDVTPPSLAFTHVVGDTQLDLYFDEPVRTEGISPASIRLETGAAQEAEALDPGRLRAGFPGPVTGESVRIGAVSDLRGNVSEQVSAPIHYRPAAQDVVVNEISYEPLADEYDGLPNEVEFIELFNRSGRRVYLDGAYRTRDPDESGDADTVRVRDRFVGLGPGGYALLAAEAIAADSAMGAGTDTGIAAAPTAAMVPGLSLRNDGDRIRIHREDGETLDDIRYDPSWHHPDVLETRGVTLERIDPDAYGNDPQNWTSSAAPEGGTPGRPNSVRMDEAPSPSGQGMDIAPNPFSPDRDGVDDIVRIRCVFSSGVSRARALVFDLAGNEVRELVESRLVTESTEFFWDGRDHADRRLQTGVYIIFVEAWDARNHVIEAFKAPVVLAHRY